MTAPVATKIVPGQGPFCKSHFTVAFYVPYALQVSFKSAPRHLHSAHTIIDLLFASSGGGL